MAGYIGISHEHRGISVPTWQLELIVDKLKQRSNVSGADIVSKMLKDYTPGNYVVSLYKLSNDEFCRAFELYNDIYHYFYDNGREQERSIALILVGFIELMKKDSRLSL